MIVRPTHDALALGLFLAATLGVAWWSGDNLLYLVACSLLAVALLSLPGPRGLRTARLRRRLPDELVARRGARGALVVEADAPLGPFVALDPDARAAVAVGGVERGEAELPVQWRFERRGLVRLRRLTLRTSAPFGLIERQRDIEVEDDVVVWPDPAPGGRCVNGVDPLGAARQDGGTADEVADLRPYRPGDALRDVHAPTSARVGAPIVVVRRPVGQDEAWIVVPAAQGEAFEAELRKAAGALTDAWLAGRAVGLRVGGVVLPPRVGPAWRRRLLEVLALARADGGPR
jgi:uncharacterized protein (DUF58 family)